MNPLRASVVSLAGLLILSLAPSASSAAAEVSCWKKSVSQRGADLYTLPDVPGITFRVERLAQGAVKLGLQMKGVAEYADHVHVRAEKDSVAGVIAKQQVSRTAIIPVAGAFWDQGKLILIYKGAPGTVEPPRYMFIDTNGRSICNPGTGSELAAAQNAYKGAEVKEVQIPASNMLEFALGL